MQQLIEKQVFFKSDACFLCIMNDKIIINDMDGFLLYDEELNPIRRVAVPSMKDLCLYEIYPLGEEVLIDSGDGELVLVDLESGVDKKIQMPDILDREKLTGCARVSANTILMRSNREHDYRLNTDTMDIAACTSMESDIEIDQGLNHQGVEIPEELYNRDFISAASLAGIDFYIYEKKMLIVTPDGQLQRYPKEKYLFNRIGVMYGRHPQIVVLGRMYAEYNAFLASYRFCEN